jgi:hypothetical protein
VKQWIQDKVGFLTSGARKIQCKLEKIEKITCRTVILLCRCVHVCAYLQFIAKIIRHVTIVLLHRASAAGCIGKIESIKEGLSCGKLKKHLRKLKILWEES